MADLKEQRHPQYYKDRDLVNDLLTISSPSDRHLADLARLQVRYQDFPGAKDIQRDLEKLLDRWQLSLEQLYQITREIHRKGGVYGRQSDRQDDWA